MIEANFRCRRCYRKAEGNFLDIVRYMHYIRFIERERVCPPSLPSGT